jgi:hypothetical protein
MCSLSADQKEFYGSKQLFVDMYTEAKQLVLMVSAKRSQRSCRDCARDNTQVNGDPKLVIDAMEQAVTCRFPFRRCEYDCVVGVGFDVRVFVVQTMPVMTRSHSDSSPCCPTASAIFSGQRDTTR